jgi:hypothetical protein
MPATAAPLTPQETNDLLHKLITESRKVHAAFISPHSVSGVQAFVSGTLRVSQDTRGDYLVNVLERESASDTPELSFNPSAAVSCTYADVRPLELKPAVADYFKKQFSSAITFMYADGSLVALFEFAEKER